MVSTCVQATTPEEATHGEETDVMRRALTVPGFVKKIYDTLFCGGEYIHTDVFRAPEEVCVFANRAPIFQEDLSFFARSGQADNGVGLDHLSGAGVSGLLPSFLARPDEATPCNGSFYAKDITYKDDKGELWYVIERSQSNVLQRIYQNLLSPREGVPAFVIEGVDVVRSTAVHDYPYYGVRYLIRNNHDTGKSALFQVMLYPFTM
ncbi:MAG: hypothetical protein C0514_02385 [Candidatus Puniceispirillum sp.]|nr:hypothetical protein [Candidatus Puniceispirillum sp.]